MSRLGFALVLMAAPAFADDLTYSDQATIACDANSETMPDKLECIGRAAARCMEDSAAGYSTYGMGGCAGRELTYWDTRLNRVYKTVRAAAKSRDANGIYGAIGEAEALRDMQRAWIAYRDATCTYEAAQWGGGTGAGPAFVGCQMRLTGEQALYLEYGGLGE